MTFREFKLEDKGSSEQAKNFEKEGTPEYAVKNGTLEDVQKMFPEGCIHSLKWEERKKAEGLPKQQEEDSPPPEAREGTEQHSEERALSAKTNKEFNVYKKGVFGENILHLCFLFNEEKHMEMAKYLVRTFGQHLVNTPYQKRRTKDDEPGRYEGETALHMAIVNQNREMVEFLIEQGANLLQRAFGPFFGSNKSTGVEGNCYYGEYPLLFAVCTGNTEIVDILLVKHLVKDDKDAVSTLCDCYGNCALHMAVIHHQMPMYEHLVTKHKADQSKRNYQGFTPFELAAYRGGISGTEAFNTIAILRSKEAWKFGPVTCKRLPLVNLDTVQDKPEDEAFTAVNLIIAKTVGDIGGLAAGAINVQKHMDLVCNPLIVRILTQKWKKFAKMYFYAHIIWYLLDVFLLTVLVMYARYGDGIRNLIDSESSATKDRFRYDQPVLAPKLREGYQEIHCAGSPTESDPYDMHGFQCQEPIDTYKKKEDWLYGPNRFDNHLGTVLEWLVFCFTIINMCIEIYDYYNANKVEVVRERKKEEAEQKKKKAQEECLESFHKIPYTEKPSEEGSSSNISIKNARKKLKEMKEKMERRTKRLRNSKMRSMKNILSTQQTTNYLLWISSFMRVTHFHMWASGKPLQICVDYNCDLALASLFGWLYGLQFARGFKRVGHLVIMLERIIKDDMPGFLIVFLIFLMAFSTAFFLLIRFEFVNGDTLSMPGDYNNIFSAMISLFRNMLGDINYASIRDSGIPSRMQMEVGKQLGREEDLISNQFPVMTTTDVNVENLKICLFLIWLCLSVILINLLIALMTSTYEKVQGEAAQQWQMQYAIIVQKMERRLTSDARKHYRLGDKQDDLEDSQGGGEQGSYHFTIEEVDINQTNRHAPEGAKRAAKDCEKQRTVAQANWLDTARRARGLGARGGGGIVTKFSESADDK